MEELAKRIAILLASNRCRVIDGCDLELARLAASVLPEDRNAGKDLNMMLIDWRLQ